MTNTDDAKTLAAAARAALRAATKTAGDPLDGLTISVRIERASMCTEIAIIVRGVDHIALVRSDDEQADGQGCWTDRARVLSERVHALIPDALAWQDGRMRFTLVYFDGGLCAPLPRTAAEIELAAMEIELAAMADDERDAEFERRNAAEVADMEADARAAADAAAAGPARPGLHLVTDDHAQFLGALGGELGGDVAQLAEWVLNYSITEGWVTDSSRLARSLRAMLAVVEA